MEHEIIKCPYCKQLFSVKVGQKLIEGNDEKYDIDIIVTKEK